MTCTIVGLVVTGCLSAAPRPSPAEAVAILRASHSAVDLTDVVVADGPTSVVIASSPTAGPYGELRFSRRFEGYGYAAGRRYSIRADRGRLGRRGR